MLALQPREVAGLGSGAPCWVREAACVALDVRSRLHRTKDADVFNRTAELLDFDKGQRPTTAVHHPPSRQKLMLLIVSRNNAGEEGDAADHATLRSGRDRSRSAAKPWTRLCAQDELPEERRATRHGTTDAYDALNELSENPDRGLASTPSKPGCFAKRIFADKEDRRRG